MADIDETAEVEMKGPRKAATFLLALDADTASKVLRNLSEAEVAAVSEEMARMRRVSPDDVDLVFQDFTNGDTSIQVEPMLQKILEKTLGPERARQLIDRIRKRRKEREPFQVLRHLDVSALEMVLKGEHPQVIALVIAHLDSTTGLDLLRGLEEDLRYEVVKRMAMTSEMPYDMIRQVDDVLSERAVEAAEQGMQGATRNRFKNIAEMLNLAEPAITKTILDRLGKDEPDAAVEIQSMMFVFEDLVKIDDRDMQKVLGSIDKDLLPLALKTASPELNDKLLGNMSKRARETLEEEIEILGPKPLAEVEEAQKQIVDIVRKMSDDGEIQISSGKEELV